MTLFLSTVAVKRIAPQWHDPETSMITAPGEGVKAMTPNVMQTAKPD
jgi:hypothetical protein